MKGAHRIVYSHCLRKRYIMNTPPHYSSPFSPLLPVRLFPILSFSPWKPNFYLLFNSFKVTFVFLFTLPYSNCKLFCRISFKIKKNSEILVDTNTEWIIESVYIAPCTIFIFVFFLESFMMYCVHDVNLLYLIYIRYTYYIIHIY